MSAEIAAAIAPARVRPPLNVFGIAFGLTGLAGTWTEAARSLSAPQVVAEGLWAVAIGAWLITLVIYLSRLNGIRSIGADLSHPVLGPFAALIPIPPMLLGAHLMQWVPNIAAPMIVISFGFSAVFGFWFISQLLTTTRGFDKVHSGYFLPTVAAALIGAQSLAAIGQSSVAMGAFGVGVLFWLLIGGAVVARVMAGPELLSTLLPTLAIFSAPPAVAGNAWWVITGGTDGAVLELLAGAMVALVAPHFFLIRRYVKLPFALGFWALTFTTAASATFSLHLLSLEHSALTAVASWVILALATALIGLIGTKSLVGARARRQPPTA
jgi:tellurite resistance protein